MRNFICNTAAKVWVWLEVLKDDIDECRVGLHCERIIRREELRKQRIVEQNKQKSGGAQ